MNHYIRRAAGILEIETDSKEYTVYEVGTIQKMQTDLVEDLQNSDVDDKFHDLIDRVVIRLQGLTVTDRISVTSVTGGPGCGKSTAIRKLYSAFKKSAVIAPYRKLIEDDYSGYRAWTLHNAIVKINDTSILLVDEFTSCDMRLVFMAAVAGGCVFIMLFGDVNQVWLREHEGVSFRDERIPVCAHLDFNYRNPKADVEKMNETFGLNMQPVSNSGSVTEFLPLYSINIEVNGVCLTFTEKSISELKKCGIESSTVRSCQGKTFANVFLFIFSWDLKLLSIKSLRLVALSRHTDTLKVYCFDVEAVKAVIDGNASQIVESPLANPAEEEEDEGFTIFDIAWLKFW